MKITATHRYVTTTCFWFCPEAGTWTCEAIRTRQPRAMRNHWSMTNQRIAYKHRRHFGSGGIEAVMVARIEGGRESILIKGFRILNSFHYLCKGVPTFCENLKQDDSRSFLERAYCQGWSKIETFFLGSRKRSLNMEIEHGGGIQSWGSSRHARWRHARPGDRIACCMTLLSNVLVASISSSCYRVHIWPEKDPLSCIKIPFVRYLCKHTNSWRAGCFRAEMPGVGA